MMRRGTGRRILAAALIIALSGVIGVSRLIPAYAWEGRAAGFGYFDNGRPYNTPYNGAIKGLMTAPNYIDSSQRPAVPYSVNTPLEFYQYMYDKYHHSGNAAYSISYGTYNGIDWDQKDRTGISFMVNVLNQNDGPHAHRVLTDDDWAQVKARLLQPQVKLVQMSHTTASAYRGEDSYYQVSRDDVGNTVTEDDGGRAFALTYNGAVKWVMLYKCGNLLGDWNGIPPPVQQTAWDIDVDISTAQDSVNVGDTVTWQHTVTQTGPNATDQTVTYGYGNGGNIAGIFDSGTLAKGTAAGTTRTFSTTYTPTRADSGKTVCRRTYANPGASGQPVTYSAYACVDVNTYYNYELHPVVTLPGGGTRDTIEPGGNPKDVTGTVTITGETGSKPTAWQLTRCVYAPGTAAPTVTAETNGDGTAAATFGGACTVPQSGTATYTGPTGYAATETDTNRPAGTRICYILSVNPPSNTAGGWRHSAPACFTFLKTPKVQVLGGDVRAGLVQTAPPRDVGGMTYGSWAQYGIFGIGGITGMGSAASLAGGAASVTAARQNALTFANNGSGGCPLGCFYSQAPVQADYAAYSAVPGPGATGAGEAVPNGTREVRHASGNLVISGNITYSGSYADPSQVPRVIYVVDGDITVAAGVTRIDAWLIATGTLYTCADFTNPAVQKLTTGTCNQPLTFNGPVTVAKTVLGRTFGADATPASRASAAEVFNLAPSNYLSGYAAGQSQSNIQTVYEKELPPRY